MDNLQNLLEKYWAGTSTLEEEKILKSHWKNNPSSSHPEHAIFEFFEGEKLKNSQREFKTPAVVTNQGQSRGIVHFRKYVFSIAASLILLMGVMWTISNYNQSSSNEIVVDDPETALQITKEAFALLNGKMDKSEKALIDNIVHLEKTLIFKSL